MQPGRHLLRQGGRHQEPGGQRSKANQHPDQDAAGLLADHRRPGSDPAVKQHAGKKEHRQAVQDVDVSPVENIGSWMLEVVKINRRQDVQHQANHIPDPAQVRPVFYQAGFLRENQRQVNHRAARAGQRQRPEQGQPVGGIQVEQSGAGNAHRSGKQRKGPPGRLRAAHPEDP